MCIARHLLGLGAVALVVSSASAQNPLRSYFGVAPEAPKPQKPFNILEHRLFKHQSGPSISCSSCYGYHSTSWRPWSEACGEPQYFEVAPQMSQPMPSATEQSKPAPPKPMENPPKANEKGPVPMQPKAPEVKPLEKKKLDAPTALTIPQPLSDRMQIAIPAIPELKPMPINKEVKPIVPTIIVPLSSR